MLPPDAPRELAARLITKPACRHGRFPCQLSAIQTPSGPLLDQGVAVNTSQLSTGPDHGFKPLPFILAGTAGGFLKKGQLIDVGSVSTSVMLNTLAAALGVDTSMGGRSGTIGQMLA